MIATTDAPEEQWRSLVHAAQQGNQAALDDLARLLTPWIERYCQARSRLLEAAGTSVEDLVQDIWVSLLGSLHGYQPHSGRPFLTWVHTIVGNWIANAQRRSSHPQSLSLDALPGDVPTPVRGDPARIAEHRDQVSMVADALAKLAPRRREALLRHVNGERDHRIAALMGSSMASVQVARHRAMRTLRKVMTNYNLTQVA